MKQRKRKPGGGRKPRSGEAATVQVQIRLTPSEAAKLRALAGGETIAAYIRKLLRLQDD